MIAMWRCYSIDNMHFFLSYAVIEQNIANKLTNAIKHDSFYVVNIIDASFVRSEYCRNNSLLAAYHAFHSNNVASLFIIKHQCSIFIAAFSFFDWSYYIKWPIKLSPFIKTPTYEIKFNEISWLIYRWEMIDSEILVINTRCISHITYIFIRCRTLTVWLSYIANITTVWQQLHLIANVSVIAHFI